MSLCVSRWQLKGCYSMFLSAVLSSWYPTHLGSLSMRVSVTLLDARPFLRVHVWHRTIHKCHCQAQAWEEVNSWNCYTFYLAWKRLSTFGYQLLIGFCVFISTVSECTHCNYRGYYYEFILFFICLISKAWELMGSCFSLTASTLLERLSNRCWNMAALVRLGSGVWWWRLAHGFSASQMFSVGLYAGQSCIPCQTW